MCSIKKGKKKKMRKNLKNLKKQTQFRSPLLNVFLVMEHEGLCALDWTVVNVGVKVTKLIVVSLKNYDMETH